MKKYIHVNQHKILPCGARVVIETESEVTFK